MAIPFFIMNKHVIFFGVVFSILFFTALPSFAEDVNFTLSDYPMHSMEPSSTYGAFGGFVKSTNDNYYYVEFTSTRSQGGHGTSYYLSCGSFYVNSYNLFSPIYYIPSASSGNGYARWSKCYIYDTEGNLLKEFNPQATVIAYSNTKYFYVNCYTSGSLTSNEPYLKMTQLNDFVITQWGVNDFEVPLNANNEPPLFTGNNASPKSSPSYYGEDVIDTLNPTSDFSGSGITDNIYVNGQLVYGTGGSNIATSIISNGIGSLVPEYDANNNIVSYSFDITTVADYSPIFDYRPEYDVPGLEFDFSSDMPNVEFNQNQLSNLAVMDGGTALTWFYARINDLGAGNVKILALITSCLSLGFITLILNKRV